MSIVIVSNNRSEHGPLESVIAALPEADVVGLSDMQQRGPPAKVMSFALWWFNREFTERAPKLVIVLGDRYETLAAAQAAMFLRIPVAHIHGGETTAGAFDDSVRHAITHLSTLHFCSTHAAMLRVHSMFGWPELSKAGIHLVGAPGLDGVTPQSATRERKLVLVTYHPETRKPDYGLNTCREMLTALPLGYETIFCGVNNDPGSDDIRALIADWLKTHGGRVEPALSHAEYIALMQQAAVVVGNSSSIPIEAAWINVPSVLIGDRQLGRELAGSVFQNDHNIGAAINSAFNWRGQWSPIYKGGAAVKIREILEQNGFL